ncbi:LysR family transcriptional regulator [Paracoccus liaowanqingii]|uniref:LysR family transcriptional regulator n=1 Tax=Paracoccus liaowanqingii TaxID=2560053 RepID=UPI001F0ECFAB|nr:LysR family transcriptional regulator [Paracoccus liaowanqingii]
MSELLLFQAVAEEGSFTRAARKLGRAQSGISQAITSLKKRIGVPLLARTTRNVRPTEAGKHLLKSLNPALRLIEDGLTELKEARSGVAGTPTREGDPQRAPFHLTNARRSGFTTSGCVENRP